VVCGHMCEPLTAHQHPDAQFLNWKSALARSLQMLISDAVRTGSCVPPQTGVVGNLCDDIVAYFLACMLDVPAAALGCRLQMQEKEIMESGAAAHSHIYALLLASSVPQFRRENLVLFMADPVGHLSSWDWEDAWLTSTRLCEFLCYVERFYPDMISSCYRRVRAFVHSDRMTGKQQRSGDLLARIGVISHLLPYEVKFGEPFEVLSNTLLSEILESQHHDGFFYPVPGGGACPDLNAVNLLSFYFRACPISVTAFAALQKFIRAMTLHLERCWQPENYRGGPISIPERSGQLPPAVIDWIAREEVGGVSLYDGDVWSTMIRYCALMKARGVVSGLRSDNLKDHYQIWMPTCTLC
jgi:hypothetical protein